VADPVKVAVAVWFAFIVTEHVVVVPLQAPVQLVKLLPEAALAVSVTTAPLAKVALQVPLVAPPALVQVIPAGLDVIVPVPLPAPVTVSVKVVGGGPPPMNAL
jgi:hypothetical protein